MALQKITRVNGTCAVMAGDDVDTDRIIPARFMKCVTFDGLGEFLFYDVRFDPATGQPTDHPLNDPAYRGATILIGGRNFGCGSSREHAPQAIYRYGFRAIVAESYAEIFFGNSTTLGLPCVTATRADLAAIREIVEADPKTPAIIDLDTQTLQLGERSFPIQLRPSAREVLMNGHWDAIADLLEAGDQVAQRVAQLPYMARAGA